MDENKDNKDSANVLPPAPEKKKTVEVDAEVLSKLLTTVEGYGQKIKDLEGAADVGRLSRIQQARASGKLIKTAKLRKFDDKVILAWYTIKNDVYTDERGVIHEDQQIKLILNEGFDDKGKRKTSESAPMSYKTFDRLVTKVEGEVVKESRDKEGAVLFTIQLEDGSEFELPIVFIN